ncbi:MAG TPA: hypothetical protein VKH37_00905, partial [Ferruginibacter sp.]|nr:hypothetical protein [Ferruginibacter sp.]
GYRKALELSLGADLQLLIGDTTPYYAASKLMSLAASGRPFFAVINRASFPAEFLRELGFQNKFEFDVDELTQPEIVDRLARSIIAAIDNRNLFQSIPADNKVLDQYTAFAMTKTFSDTIKNVIHE